MSSSSECESSLVNGEDKLLTTFPVGNNYNTFLGSETYRIGRNYNQWSPLEEGVTLAWRDVSVYVKCRQNGYKRVVSNVSGVVKTGSLVALMGASGAGKTTLMTALAHRSSGSSIVEGTVLINGRPVDTYMRFLSAFMHQDDLFIGALTVFEHMNMMARLKLDRRTSKKQRLTKINQVLSQLSLIHCMNKKIGFDGEDKVLSGGEKKRLSFATELLTDPQLLFCDEPTTGLDSYSARKIVAIMNQMASSGKTIVCTIHQPSSEVFAMFSQLLLLGDGRIAFMGSSSCALKFFTKLGYKCPNNYNPAEFFVRTLAMTPGAQEASKQAVKRICDHFAVSDYAKEIDVVIQYEFHMGRSIDVGSYALRRNFKEPHWYSKFYWLTYRFILTVLRDSSIQTIKIVQKLVLAFIIGLCYMGTAQPTQTGIQAVQGALFVFVSENTFNPMYSVLASFPLDFPLFLREYQSGLYSVATYYVSKVVSMIPGLVIEAILFTVIAYWCVGLNSSVAAFLITAFVVTLTIVVATSCGIFFSNAFDSVTTAMTFLVPFDFMLMITSGIFLKLSSLPSYLSWIKYLSWIMYSSEAMNIVQWDGVHNITCDESNPDLPCIRDGADVLHKYNFDAEHLYKDILYMIVLFFLFHTLGMFCLWRKTKK